MNAAEFKEAIEVFVRGFAFMRCLTHPYLVALADGLWVLRDAPRKSSADYRVEEWVSYNIPAAEVDRKARVQSRGRFAVSVFRQPTDCGATIREAYKNLGYRLIAAEPLFIHRMRRIPRIVPPVTITRVDNRELADQLAQTWRQRPLADEFLQPQSPLRQYVAQEGGDIVGAVRSIAIGTGGWVGDLYVMKLHRRRGIGRALLVQLLRDERARGVQRSVLLASREGALLYPTMGYQLAGELLLFTPPRP